MSVNETDRNLYIDRLKGLAIFGVMCIHSLVYGGEGIAQPIKNLVGMGVYAPYLFLMVSGIGAIATYEKSEYSYIKFITRRYIRLAPLYIIMIFFWFAINSFLSFIDCSVIAFNQNHEIVPLILNILLLHGISADSVNSVVPGGWYIGTLFMLYIMFPVLLLIVKKTRQLFNNLLFGGIVVVYFISLLGREIVNSEIYLMVSNVLDLKPLFRSLPSFLMGMYLYSNKEEEVFLTCNKKNKFVLVIGVLLVMILTEISMYSGKKGYDVDFSFIVLHVCIYLLFRSFEENKNLFKFIGYIGRNSYYLYLIHALPFWYGGAVYYSYINRMNTNLAYFIYFFMAMMITIGLSVIMKRIAYPKSEY